MTRREPIFEVNLEQFEPHSLHSGKGHKDVKRELREAIVRASGVGMIEEARQNLRGKTVEIRVHFRLWKGSERTSNTRCKKDLDNLLKPVLDVLQDSLNAQNGEGGLGLIEDDDAVYNLSASKGLVESEQDEGVRIVILERGLVPGTNRSSAGNHERMLDHSVGD